MSHDVIADTKKLHESPVGVPVKVGHLWKVKMPFGIMTRKSKTACLEVVSDWCAVDPSYKAAVEAGATKVE